MDKDKIMRNQVKGLQLALQTRIVELENRIETDWEKAKRITLQKDENNMEMDKLRSLNDKLNPHWIANDIEVKKRAKELYSTIETKIEKLDNIDDSFQTAISELHQGIDTRKDEARECQVLLKILREE